MKALLLLSFWYLVTTNNLQAFNTIEIDGGDEALGRAQVELIDQSPLCDRSSGLVACMAYGSKVQIKITLNGCLDRLGPIFHQVEIKKHKAILYVGAVNIHNIESTVTRCMTPPVEYKTIIIPHEGLLEVRNMAFQGETLTNLNPIL